MSRSIGGAEPITRSLAAGKRNEDRRKIHFCSPHCYVDPVSGAALATRDLLEALAARGWDCRVVCGVKVDLSAEIGLLGLLRQLGIPHVVHSHTDRLPPFSLVHCKPGGVPTTICHTPTQHASLTSDEGRPLVAGARQAMDAWRPSLLVTYGGDWVSDAIRREARERGVPVIFGLHNDRYNSADLFHAVDGVFVTSQSLADRYARTLGIASTALPCPINWERVRCQQIGQRYVTLVNPSPDQLKSMADADADRGVEKARNDYKAERASILKDLGT